MSTPVLGLRILHKSLLVKKMVRSQCLTLLHCQKMERELWKAISILIMLHSHSIVVKHIHDSTNQVCCLFVTSFRNLFVIHGETDRLGLLPCHLICSRLALARVFIVAKLHFPRPNGLLFSSQLPLFRGLRHFFSKRKVIKGLCLIVFACILLSWEW